MNTQIIAAFIIGATIAGCSTPAPQQAYYTASAAPNTRQECWVEDVPVYVAPQPRSNMGALLGGVAGGIIGNQVGGGKGRNAATLAGAVIGTITGERLDNPQQQQPQYTTQRIQRCRMVY